MYEQTLSFSDSLSPHVSKVIICTVLYTCKFLRHGVEISWMKRFVQFNCQGSPVHHKFHEFCLFLLNDCAIV